MRSSVRNSNVTHLTTQQLNSYASRTLSAAEVLQVDDHLAVCLECCESLQSVLQASNGGNRAVNLAPQELTADREDFHLSFEQISAFIENQLDEVDQEIIASHLEFCPHCQAEIEDLQAFKQALATQIPPSAIPSSAAAPKWWERWKTIRRWPSRWMLLPVAAMLGLGAFGVALYLKQHEPIALQTTPTPQNIVLPTAPPKDAPAPAASPEKTIPESPEERAMQLALTTGRVEIPAESKSLRLQGGNLMSGSGKKDTFTVLSPQGIIVESTQPRLRWTRLPEAKNYVVTISDQNFNSVAQSPSLTTDTWISSVKLERGRIYQWQVTASTEDGKEITAPLPSAPEAKFKVLSHESLNSLNRARQRYAGSHLELGISYARVGLLDEAAREFQAEKARPQLARRLLNHLQQQRR